MHKWHTEKFSEKFFVFKEQFSLSEMKMFKFYFFYKCYAVNFELYSINTIILLCLTPFIYFYWQYLSRIYFNCLFRIVFWLNFYFYKFLHSLFVVIDFYRLSDFASDSLKSNFEVKFSNFTLLIKNFTRFFFPLEILFVFIVNTYILIFHFLFFFAWISIFFSIPSTFKKILKRPNTRNIILFVLTTQTSYYKTSIKQFCLGVQRERESITREAYRERQTEYAS